MTSTAQSGSADDQQVYRVLLIEDDDADAILVEELLLDTGLHHELTVSTTIAAAKQILATQRIDCILLDLHLPDAAGTAAITAVRELAPHNAVIVLTGLAEEKAGTDAMAAGAQDYLVKGKVEPELLRRTLRYAVYRSRTERTALEAQTIRLRAEENARLERGLLPPPILGTSTVTVTSRYLPGTAMALLGGDFLDVVVGDDGLLHAVVGDVSGHGRDAAALGVLLRASWRALVLGGHRGADLLHLMERVLVAERGGESYFATCTLLTLDQQRGTATVHLAGHHEPLLTGPGGTVEVSAAHGIALGILPGLRNWPSTTVPLPEAGALTIYTDGLTEGHNGSTGARLGTDGLLALINTAAPTDPATHVDLLIRRAQTLNAHRHTDDLAVLHLQWSPQ
ncbi:PP2C family protein-serine/threonine phosphatase [Kitasatospora sp. NPDC101801]|uniref:PP2C family protein-serine/threonine phosphatase n=1 Tax=Kitasatospora sp. NPDC101801 TaxID=3364103 RepID=UPI00380B8C9B